VANNAQAVLTVLLAKAIQARLTPARSINFSNHASLTVREKSYLTPLITRIYVSSRTNYHENGVLASEEESIYGRSVLNQTSASDCITSQLQATFSI